MKFLYKMKMAGYKDENIPQAFRKLVAKHPNKPMFIDADDGTKWSYKQVGAQNIVSVLPHRNVSTKHIS